MPYDSFLLDPFMLFVTGLCASWIIALRPIHHRPWAMKLTVLVTMVIYWGTSISLYFDLEWTRWLWEMCGAATGRDWMLNSGVFHFDYQNPGALTHLISALIFCTYPLWLLLGMALGMPRLQAGHELGAPRWRGRKLRQEVWYGTATNPQTGDGLWLHAETVAPPDAPAYAHGWAVFFPTTGEPVLSRFGPQPIEAKQPSPPWFATENVTLDASLWRGQTPRISWNLQQKILTRPLMPFSRWLWEMELLPAVMVVLDPQAQWQGDLTVDGRASQFAGTAGLARIYGHGSAARWAWLHADLGNGDVLEVVSAVSLRPGLNRMKPLAFVRMRTHGVDWPRLPLWAALTAFKCEPTLPKWTLDGTIGSQRLHVEVNLPPERCVVVDYRDPDGRPAKCTNSARADATVVLEERRGGTWAVKQRWELAARAHAEVGLR